MIGRLLDRLVQVKNGLKLQAAIAAYCDEPAPPEPAPPTTEIEVIGDDDDYDEDEDPLTWAEQRNIRKELRRFQLWHALRLKVPKGFEESE